ESDKGFKLNARDDDENTADVSVLAEKTKAQKSNLAESNIKNQLSKLNDTIFACGDIAIKLKQMYFIPLSVLNGLRRDAVSKLLDEREKNRPKKSAHILVNDIPYPSETIDYLGNCLNKKAQKFYERHGVIVSELAAESGIDMSGRMVMASKYCVKRELGLCKKNTGALYLIDEDGRKYPLKFNCKECRMEIFFPG
ncbi:MAG: DUF3656 domain-containing protein, partial [Candidatus Omnitrophica bacterium]|nr:DUF3656 domain-containing protein [Candidatus Omnitrophota bacterium]